MLLATNLSKSSGMRLHFRRQLRCQSLLTFAHDVVFMLHVQMQGVHITLRMRLFCEVFRNGKPMKGQQYEVLNEVVVDRGANPYLTKIECYEQGRLITKVDSQSPSAMLCGSLWTVADQTCTFFNWFLQAPLFWQLYLQSMASTNLRIADMPCS